MNIGIVGHAAEKFDSRTEEIARRLIRRILTPPDEVNNIIMVSGHSPMGGIDIWAEEIADELGIKKDLKIPRQNSWEGEYGFKARNLDIARQSDILCCISVEDYPVGYSGMVFEKCYHHRNTPEVPRHVKGGGCYTAQQALLLAQKNGLQRIVIWFVIGKNEISQVQWHHPGEVPRSCISIDEFME